jgi:NAD(P)-dependent dehydrogenase (short-subunit alcohol dehydrogenase family)
MTSTIEGKRALVTGAGRGVGQEIAVGLAGQGANLILAARSQDQLEETARRIHAAGGTADVIVADLGKSDGISEFLDQLTERFPTVDIVINNAATVAPLGTSAAVSSSEWSDALTLNVTAVARISFALLPGMLHSGWGRIVNVSSGIVEHPTGMIGGNAYVTSKAALEAHTVNLAAELLGTGITVNVYRPGSVDTAMQEWIRAQTPDAATADLHARFHRSFTDGTLITARQSASSLLSRLEDSTTGNIWTVTVPS